MSQHFIMSPAERQKRVHKGDFLAGIIANTWSTIVMTPIQKYSFPKIAEFLKKECPIKLWQGSRYSLHRAAFIGGLNYFFKGMIGRFVLPADFSKHKLQFVLGKVLCGLFSGVVPWTFVYPMDIIRGKLLKEGKVFNCSNIKAVMHAEGLKGIYNGFAGSLYWLCGYRAVLIGCYDTINKYLWPDNSKAPTLHRYLLGQTVALGAGVIFVPLDKIRVKMQADKKAYSGVFDCANKIFEKEGICGFYMGGLHLIKLSLGTALTILFYEESRKRVYKNK